MTWLWEISGVRIWKFGGRGCHPMWIVFGTNNHIQLSAFLHVSLSLSEQHLSKSCLISYAFLKGKTSLSYVLSTYIWSNNYYISQKRACTRFSSTFRHSLSSFSFNPHAFQISSMPLIFTLFFKKSLTFITHKARASQLHKWRWSKNKTSETQVGCPDNSWSPRPSQAPCPGYMNVVKEHKSQPETSVFFLTNPQLAPSQATALARLRILQPERGHMVVVASLEPRMSATFTKIIQGQLASRWMDNQNLFTETRALIVYGRVPVCLGEALGTQFILQIN